MSDVFHAHPPGGFSARFGGDPSRRPRRAPRCACRCCRDTATRACRARRAAAEGTSWHWLSGRDRATWRTEARATCTPSTRSPATRRRWRRRSGWRWRCAWRRWRRRAARTCRGGVAVRALAATCCRRGRRRGGTSREARGIAAAGARTIATRRRRRRRRRRRGTRRRGARRERRVSRASGSTRAARRRARNPPRFSWGWLWRRRARSPTTRTRIRPICRPTATSTTIGNGRNPPRRRRLGRTGGDRGETVKVAENASSRVTSGPPRRIHPADLGRTSPVRRTTFTRRRTANP